MNHKEFIYLFFLNHRYLSATFQIPVFVTNQVTTRFDTPVGFEKNKKIYNPSIEESPSNYVVAALGNTWSHAVNTRLIVEYSSTLGILFFFFFIFVF